MGIADMITEFILQTLSDVDGVLEISRNELAERFRCVPSQINYVLTTRFSPEHGYIVETKRGSSGYIRITQVRVGAHTLIMHTINAIGDKIDARCASAFLQNLSDVLDKRIVSVVSAAIGDKALKIVEPSQRDSVRASILKQCLIHLM